MELDLSILERKPYRIISHILFWLIIVACLTIVFGIKQEEYFKALQDTLLYLPAEMLFTYASIYWLIPRYLLKGKVLNFFLGFVALFLVSGLLGRAVQHYIIYPLNHPYYADFPFFYLERILRSLVVPVAIAGVASSIKLFKLWNKDNQDKLQLQQKSLEAELKFLKSQIHPHFLFNTLNNLYSHTLKNSEDSPDIVLKLSELLHYMLYECNARYVPLSKELDTINTYLELEKIRYGEDLDISYSLQGEVKDQLIAPLLLVPFIENSFTHGVSESMDHPWMSLDITVKGDHLTFRLSNSINEHDTKNGNGSIGIQNVNKRLELLYKDGHKLEMIKDEETYLVLLELNLKEN